MISQFKKGFTLVELMIVMAIIGMLAAAITPSLSGYLSRGRDADKINQMSQLNAGLVLFQVANRTYKVSGAGAGGNGDGWMNFSNGGTYPKSLFVALQEKGFINKKLQDNPAADLNKPPVTQNTAPCVTTTSSQNLYMLYYNDAQGKYAISGYLENQKAADIANIQASYNGIGANGTCTLYGRNYAIGIN